MSHGPLPAAVYWRRRLLILAVLIALAWLAYQAVTSGADGDDAKPAATPTPRATTAAVPTDGALDVALATDDRACDPQQVRISPTVASGQLNRGAVRIGLVVSTTEATACTLQPRDADLIAVISANDTPVWDSTLCQGSLLADPVQLAPDWSTLVTTSWSGRVSGGGCASTEPFASPGRYTVQLGTLGGEPGKASFVLDPRPKAPKPKASKPTPTKRTPSKPSPSPTETSD